MPSKNPNPAQSGKLWVTTDPECPIALPPQISITPEELTRFGFLAEFIHERLKGETVKLAIAEADKAAMELWTMVDTIVDCNAIPLDQVRSLPGSTVTVSPTAVPAPPTVVRLDGLNGSGN